MAGSCAFCFEDAPLQESHILPAFVFRWLKERSGVSGHIRNTENVNRRVQDGLKLPLLCESCETRFSRFETAFATKLFHPWNDGAVRVTYEEWLLKFCVSVSWRVLRYARGINKNALYTPEQNNLMDRAEARWRGFLNDEVPHPADFEQHLLLFDVMESTTIPNLPPNFNRFMTGAVTLDIVGSGRSLMTFAKLGKFIIFGIIQHGANRWEGTKVHVKQGVLKAGRFGVPAGLIPLFVEKAAIAGAAANSMSAMQRAKVDQHVIENLDKFAASEQFAAIAADVRMFGKDAALRK